MKEKTIEELEIELKELKASNKATWDTYGSELCTCKMLAKEAEIEKEIEIKKQILSDEND